MSKKKKIENETKIITEPKQAQLTNTLKNVFEIEGCKINGLGSIMLTKELRESKKVKHAIKIGVLKIDG